MIQIHGEARVPVTAETLDRMTDIVAHRGPSDRGTYRSIGAGLGVRRLSIVDVEGGHQPVHNEDETVWAVQNGELYNHEGLRRDLLADGHRFTSRCDTEVLPHLYERHGPDLVRHLRGKFGLAVWDERRRRAVIARDRLGVKPLYYAVVGDLLVFGSELKSVVTSGIVPIEHDLEAIEAYLTLGFVPAPRTPLANIHKLLPGERLVVADGKVELERYWRFPEPRPVARPLRDTSTDLLDVLDEAVRLRLMADVPLGAMLSGGLDSSLVVALMARHSPQPVQTFSIGFVEAGADNELATAREVAELFGTEHHELELSLAGEDVDLAELAWHLDEPVADLSALGFHALSRLASRHVTVALSGQGADELLGGYSRHRNASLATALLGLPALVRQPALALASRARGRFAGIAGVLSAPDAVSRQLAAFDGVRVDALLGRGRGGTAARDAVAALLDSRETGNPLETMLFLDGQLGLVDDMLHYFDRMSMAHSLEVRVPFLDHHVVEFCATVPSSLKVRGLTTKHVLKEAARGLLPDSVIDRRKVGFFNGAVDQWFQAQSRGAMSDYLLGPDPAYAAILDRSRVEALVRDHAAGLVPARKLLPVLMLEVWLSEYLPRAVTGASMAANVAVAP